MAPPIPARAPEIITPSAFYNIDSQMYLLLVGVPN